MKMKCNPKLPEIGTKRAASQPASTADFGNSPVRTTLFLIGYSAS